MLLDSRTRAKITATVDEAMPRRRRKSPLRDPVHAAQRRRAELRKQAQAERRERRRSERAASRWEKFEPAWRRAMRITANGFAGPEGGTFGRIDRLKEWRATTPQVCGLWPWALSGGTPHIGTPIGRHLYTFGDVCFDPISWVYRTPMMNTPSVFMLGLPSLGKSTVGRKLVNGAIAQGHIPIIAADLKPDYAELIEAMGGLVIRIGHGQGYFNPLGVGSLASIVKLLEDHPKARRRVRAQAQARRKRVMEGLCELVRGGQLVEHEQNLITHALRLLDQDPRFAEVPPLVMDLYELLEQPLAAASGDPSSPAEQLRACVLAEDASGYRVRAEHLLATLKALLDGPLGEVFSQQTTTPLDLAGEEAPVGVCVDISGISVGDSALEGAVLLALWEDCFGAIEAAHTLADVGLRPQRHFLAVLDELWRVLGAGVGMVGRVDMMTRLTRTLGTALLMITHTVKDLESLQAEFDVKKAKGFIERAGAVIVGGLPRVEMENLHSIIPFTGPERDMVTSWSSPAGWDPKVGTETPPPGRGKFLLKVGTDNRPGIPFQTIIGPTEQRLGFHDTNRRFTGKAAA